MRRRWCRASEPRKWFDGGYDLHRLRGRFLCNRFLHRPRDGQFEPERSATAWRLLDRDLAAVLFDDPPGDREAEAGPLVLLRQGVVALDERLEQIRHESL